MVIQRFQVYLVNLDPTLGFEIKKTRPALVISPDEMNQYLRTVIIAPMTTKGRLYPTRVACEFEGKQGRIVLDQIRTIDRQRLIKHMGTIDDIVKDNVLRLLQELFSE